MSDRSYAVTNAAHSLRRTIQDAEEKLALLSKIPSRDDFPADTVIRVVARPRYGNTDTVLTYAFLKIVDQGDARRNGTPSTKWYFTGSIHRNPPNERWISWDRLVSWLVNDVVLESWTELAPKTDEVLTEEAAARKPTSGFARLVEITGEGAPASLLAADAWAERELAAARQEAERLRGEVGKIAAECDRDARLVDSTQANELHRFSARLRALASTGGSDTTATGGER